MKSHNHFINIESMTRYISHFLILLVLFTHSTIAMNVSVCHEHEQSFQDNISADFPSHNATDTQQDSCIDACNYCPHSHWGCR